MKTLLFFTLLSYSALAQTLLDLNPGSKSSNITTLTRINDYVYFGADNGVVGNELWKTNGTAPKLLKDLNPGKYSSNPRQFTLCNTKIFFTATTNANGEELWVIDNSIIRLVKDIYPGINSSNISQITTVGNFIYFIATDGVRGLELWKSDGINTTLARDFRVGSADGCVVSMTKHNNKLYFSRNLPTVGSYGFDAGQLWKYDPVTNIYTKLFEHQYRFIDDLTSNGGYLYYGEGDNSEYFGVYRLNADEKDGTWKVNSPGYRLSSMFNLNNYIVVAGAEEYSRLSMSLLNPVTGIYDGGIGEDIQDVTYTNGAYYYIRDYYTYVNNNFIQHYEIVRNGKILASYQPYYTYNVESLGNLVFYTAYTPAKGNELYMIITANLREGEVSDSRTDEPVTFNRLV